MITVPSTEFSKNFGQYREIAQREPVAVTSHDRITGYFISGIALEIFKGIEKYLPKAYGVEELPEETVQAILNAQMDPKHNHLNALLDEE